MRPTVGGSQSHRRRWWGVCPQIFALNVGGCYNRGGSGGGRHTYAGPIARVPAGTDGDRFRPSERQGESTMGIAIRFRADNGQYLCAEAGGGREVLANRLSAGPWETFAVEQIGPPGGALMSGQRIALRTENGSYLCAEGGGDGEVVANRTAVGPWETFTIAHADLSYGEILSGQAVILRADGGKLVRALGGGGRELAADGTTIENWEIFGVEVESSPEEAPGPEAAPPPPSAQ